MLFLFCMNMKTCNRCKEEKELIEFSKRKDSKDGFRCACKKCRCEQQDNKSYISKLSRIYSDQKIREKTKKWKHQPLSRSDFINVNRCDINYNELWHKWKDSGFIKELAPSYDRIDSTKGYVYGNCQWVTWYQNRKNSHNETKITHNTSNG